MAIDYRSAALGAVALLAAGVAAAGIVGALGVYNIGADSPHFAVTRAVIAFVRERSIAVRDGDVTVPPLNDPKHIADGASDYDAMCTSCHLAPGMSDNEMRPGLYPKPPRLADFPAQPAAEQFWIVKHGIKMSAMPAWGKTHSDEEIWNMVAFLQTLPSLTPEKYRAIVQSAAGHHEHDEHMQMDH